MGYDGGERGRATLRDVFALVREPALDPEHKVLWLLYRSYESPSGKGAYPGDELLAEHLDRSPRTVRRYRRELVEHGYLEQQLRGPKPARYRAVLPGAPSEGGGGADAAEDGAGEGERTGWPTVSELPKDDAGNYVYPEPFERAWAIYPERQGGNPKKGAYGAWRARVTNGADPKELEEGTRRYAEFVQRTNTEPQYVKMAQTFYGPKDFWREDWSVNGGGDPISTRADALAGLYGDEEEIDGS